MIGQSLLARTLALLDKRKLRQAAYAVLHHWPQIQDSEKPQQLRYTWCVGKALRELGRPVMAARLFERMAFDAHTQSLPLELAYAEEGLAWCKFRLGEVQEADELQRSSMQFFMVEGLPAEKMHRHSEYALICLKQDRLTEAEEHAKRAHHLSRRSPDPLDEQYCRGNLAQVYERLNETRFAHAIYRSLTAEVRASDDPYFHSEWRLGLGRVRLSLGDVEGEEDIEASIEVARQADIYHRLHEGLAQKRELALLRGELETVQELSNEIAHAKAVTTTDLPPPPRAERSSSEAFQMSEWIRFGLGEELSPDFAPSAPIELN